MLFEKIALEGGVRTEHHGGAKGQEQGDHHVVADGPGDLAGPLHAPDGIERVFDVAHKAEDGTEHEQDTGDSDGAGTLGGVLRLLHQRFDGIDVAGTEDFLILEDGKEQGEHLPGQLRVSFFFHEQVGDGAR